jgi:hypothetical protein
MVLEAPSIELCASDRFASTLLITALIFAVVRLARDQEISRSSPRLTSVIEDSISLARMLIEKIERQAGAKAATVLICRSMCGRFGRRADKQRIAEWMQTHNTDVFDDSYLAPSHNVAPQSLQPVSRLSSETGERELAIMRLGLIPFFAKVAIRTFTRALTARGQFVSDRVRQAGSAGCSLT